MEMDKRTIEWRVNKLRLRTWFIVKCREGEFKVILARGEMKFQIGYDEYLVNNCGTALYAFAKEAESFFAELVNLKDFKSSKKLICNPKVVNPPLPERPPDEYEDDDEKT